MYRKLYDLYVLKPFWLLFIALTVSYLYHKDWLSGIFVAIAWFGIGVVGGQLYPEKSPKELAKGNIPTKEEISSTIKKEISTFESRLIGKAHLKVSLFIGFGELIILWHYDLRWYFIIPLGILAGYISFILIIFYWMIILFIKRKIDERSAT
jgi:hypothetical protein